MVFGNNLIKRNHMKKFTLITLAAILHFAACQDVETVLVKENILSVVIEQDEMTRTEMDENNNILWTENDQIVAFLKTSYGHKYQVKPSFVGKSYADFSMVSSSSGNDLSAGNEWEHNVVYYPYSETVECLKSGDHYILDVVLPSEQCYTAGSFSNGAMAMVAVSEDNNIIFKNILGGIKFQLKGTQRVKSIVVKGKNNEKLSGLATVTAYTSEIKPAITMGSDASTVVALDCGEGVQLNESTSTEFIITLPPVIFSNGFTMEITDCTGNTYIRETERANTVLRSSLLVMPVVKVGAEDVEEDDDSGNEDELIIPVSYVNLSETKLNLFVGYITQLTAKVGPKDATNQTLTWSSDNSAVAFVDQTGLVQAVGSGKANISATAGGVLATCSITVSENAVANVNYVDEYGVNHGVGIVLGNTVWAPVNCGYHENDYPYGKLYQWGRKYGQGYDASDASVPDFEEGGVSAMGGNHKTNSNVFYLGSDWCDPQNDDLWNSGTESNPIKTEYDPCPTGWRVPTMDELNDIFVFDQSLFGKNEEGQYGRWFNGGNLSVEASKVFLLAAGYRDNRTGDVNYRGEYGMYWSSREPSWRYGASAYGFKSTTSSNGVNYIVGNDDERATAYSVRCVQE